MDVGSKPDAQGWMQVRALFLKVLEQFEGAKSDCLESFSEAMYNLAKGQRVEIRKEWIRATCGHSLVISWDDTSVPTQPLYHGTQLRLFRKIERQGLPPMKRSAVQLTSNLSYARSIADDLGRGIVFQIDCDASIRSGVKFSVRSDHVWCATAIPPECLTIVSNRLPVRRP